MKHFDWLLQVLWQVLTNQIASFQKHENVLFENAWVENLEMFLLPRNDEM